MFFQSKKNIHKRSDPAVQELRHIREGKKKTYIFCEGLKITDELLASPLTVQAICCDIDSKNEVKGLLIKHSQKKVPVVLLDKKVMNFVSDLSTPPGVIAIANRPSFKESLMIQMQKTPLILVLHGVQLPQNCGALIRTAEAAGVSEIWVTENSADPFGPKAIRAGSGGVFRMPIRWGVNFREGVQYLCQNNIALLAANPTGSCSYDKVNWNRPLALVVGSEGQGFDPGELKYFDEQVRIPMYGKIESLNVGVAAAVCLFEAQRQRQTQSQL